MAPYRAARVEEAGQPQADSRGVTTIGLGPDYENLNNSQESLLDELGEILIVTAHNAETPLVVIDLPYTMTFGSVFLGVLFRVWLRLKSRQSGRLGLCQVTPFCREVLQITHLDRIWEVFDTRDEAVRALAR